MILFKKKIKVKKMNDKTTFFLYLTKNSSNITNYYLSHWIRRLLKIMLNGVIFQSDNSTNLGKNYVDI